MEVLIREFRREDVDGLYFLDRRCYAPPYRLAYHQLVSTLLDRDVVALVAEAEGWTQAGVIGALILRGEHWQKRMSIVALMVEAPFRRQGLGRRLLAWAERLARAQGYGELVVPLEADNEGAAAFLAACGFEDTGQAEPWFTDTAAGTLWRLTFDAERAS